MGLRNDAIRFYLYYSWGHISKDLSRLFSTFGVLCNIVQHNILPTSKVYPYSVTRKSAKLVEVRRLSLLPGFEVHLARDMACF